MQSKVVALQLRERLGGGLDAGDLRRPSFVEQLADALALPLVVFDHQHAAQALRELGLEPAERLDQLLALDRLERVADRAALERLAASSRRPTRRAPGCGGSRVVLELIEHAQAGMIGQVDVEQDRVRTVGAARPPGRRWPSASTTHWNQLVRQVAQDRREAHVVFDDEDAARVRRRGDRGRPRPRGAAKRRRGQRGARAGSRLVTAAGAGGGGRRQRRRCRRRRADVGQRQRQREGAALARRALHA